MSDLRLFGRIVGAGSLSETARRLNSSLPAVSRRLAALEARLGVRLLERGSRHVALTEEGRLYYERGLAILADIDAVEAEIGLNAKDPHGRLRVGAPLEIGRRLIAPLIAEFTHKYPRITVELSLSDAKHDLLTDELDVGLQADLPSDGSIMARKLIASRRVVCASPGYLAQAPAVTTPDDLLMHDCMCWIRGRHVLDAWPFQEAGERREVRVKGRLTTNNGEVLHDWALAGRGIAFKVHWDIAEDLKAGRLIELLAPYACDELNLYAIYVTRSHLPSRLRVFMDFIADALQRR